MPRKADAFQSNAFINLMAKSFLCYGEACLDLSLTGSFGQDTTFFVLGKNSKNVLMV